MLIKLSPYLIAMLIGLIVGVERERRSMKAKLAMGVRSFLLFALVGAIAGGINQPLIALSMFIFATAATLAGYVRISRITGSTKSVGLTTEIAAMATFGLGYFANKEPLLSLALGVVMVLVLHNKSVIHTFIKEHLRPDEVQAAAILLLLAVGVIPLIPDTAVDPFDIFYPRRLAIIIALIAGIQFLGYATSRIFGDRIGTPLSGFLAGIISSTAAFVTYPQLAKSKPNAYLALAAAATFAIVATLLQVIVLLAAISFSLMVAVIIPLFAITAVTAGIAFILWRKSDEQGEQETVHKNPLSIFRAIKLGVILIALIFIVELSERFLGTTFTKLITFLGALFELHGVSIASANMLVNKTISLESASGAILIAVAASMVSKVGLTAIFGNQNFRKLMLLITSGLLLLSVGFWLLVRHVPAILLKLP